MSFRTWRRLIHVARPAPRGVAPQPHRWILTQGRNQSLEPKNQLDLGLCKSLIRCLPGRRGLAWCVVVLSQALMIAYKFPSVLHLRPIDCSKLIGYGKCPKLVNKDFLQRGWKESIKWLRGHHYERQIGEVVHVESILSLFVRTGNLYVRTLCGNI